ncbi:[Fe-Fe] hydrogenase large subunit C-terminal domain-containing protein [Thermosediminibacter oceani]|uniref:Hydrogenase large subunit domain protein n=1 Tax=Thermosediminibacter oceani (strain ATCC BAA-1034 / DSM 16646 / JW/IW-1228P) TaxID=555079 RepID=D9RXZ6_THEOJ|nr:[Fe-Fe] hydrogenase large subunit C-terminal domain-containing protein [Thermosediminibacter oceani]ADL08220.1 hydrogenase large subunit domain protein [Thermosediminibacter oceani DSM 16646]
MREDIIKLRRKIYRLIAEHARTLDNLQDVYTAVVESISDEINREEAEARVRAALGTFEEGQIPETVNFPFISVIEKACEGHGEKCGCRITCEPKAVKVNEEGKPSIDLNECISCGLCIVACPEGAITDKTEIAQTINMIKKHRRVYAVVAPAFAGQFGPEVSEEQVKTALLMLGFYDVIEVALGADMITVKEAEEFIRRMDRGDKFMITSCCCPPFVRLARSYSGRIAGMVSDSVSPMVAIARFIKAEDEAAKVVFIGPCIAKKTEAKLPELRDAVDCVLTFEELAAMFEGYKINLKELKVEVPFADASHDGRIYAHTGGVTTAIVSSIKTLRPDIDVKARQGNGIKECKKILDAIEDGTLDANFVEGMACVGGCVGGPGVLIPPEEGAKAVDEFAARSHVKEAVANDTARILFSKHKDRVKLESHRM